MVFSTINDTQGDADYKCTLDKTFVTPVSQAIRFTSRAGRDGKATFGPIRPNTWVASSNTELT